MMRCLGIVALLAPAAAFAAPALTYFAGTARTVDLHSGAVGSEEVVLSRSLDPEASTIVEIACVHAAGRPAMASPVYMKVSGSTMTISDRPDFGAGASLSGTGALFGTAWNWNHLTFSMTFAKGPYSARIEDTNFLVGDQLIARKQVFAGEAPVQLWETELDRIAPEAYRERARALSCP